MTKVNGQSNGRTYRSSNHFEERTTRRTKGRTLSHQPNGTNAFMLINASSDGFEKASKELHELRVLIDLHNTTSNELKAELCTGIVKLLRSIGERHGKPLKIEATISTLIFALSFIIPVAHLHHAVFPALWGMHVSQSAR